MVATFGEYKGNPTTTLAEGKTSLTFGLAKAEVILSNIDSIKLFVEENRKQKL